MCWLSEEEEVEEDEVGVEEVEKDDLDVAGDLDGICALAAALLLQQAPVRAPAAGEEEDASDFAHVAEKEEEAPAGWERRRAFRARRRSDADEWGIGSFFLV